MRSYRWYVGVALLVLVVAASFWMKRSALSFSGFAEIKSRLHGRGYHFAADGGHETPSLGMLISRELQSPCQINHLCKIGKMGTAWKGKIWVARNPKDWQLVCAPDDAVVHEWGEFIAFGDAALLEELEEAMTD